MIAKCIKGKGFRGAVEYDLQPHKSILLETNMAGRTPRALAKEFGMVRVLRPNLGKAVCHVSLSLHPEERMTDNQWIEAAYAWLSGMGFTNNQYVISRHTDAAHPHIHILVNRVSLGGKVVSDAHDYRRQESIMREMERRFALRQVAPSRKTGRAALKKGEVEQALRTGKSPTRLALQVMVDVALRSTATLDAFVCALAVQGAEVRLNKASTGFVSGISFALEGVSFKGSQLGKGYTWNSLQKRGLKYEQDGYATEHARSDRGTHVTHVPAGERGLVGREPATARSADAGAMPARRSKDQEYTGIDSTFEEIAVRYLSVGGQRGNSRTAGKGLSR